MCAKMGMKSIGPHQAKDNGDHTNYNDINGFKNSSSVSYTVPPICSALSAVSESW